MVCPGSRKWAYLGKEHSVRVKPGESKIEGRKLRFNYEMEKKAPTQIIKELGYDRENIHIKTGKGGHKLHLLLGPRGGFLGGRKLWLKRGKIKKEMTTRTKHTTMTQITLKGGLSHPQKKENHEGEVYFPTTQLPKPLCTAVLGRGNRRKSSQTRSSHERKSPKNTCLKPKGDTKNKHLLEKRKRGGKNSPQASITRSSFLEKKATKNQKKPVGGESKGRRRNTPGKRSRGRGGSYLYGISLEVKFIDISKPHYHCGGKKMNFQKKTKPREKRNLPLGGISRECHPTFGVRVDMCDLFRITKGL